MAGLSLAEEALRARSSWLSTGLYPE